MKKRKTKGIKLQSQPQDIGYEQLVEKLKQKQQDEERGNKQ